jgi:hypothetical protein
VDAIFNSLCDFICAPATSTEFDEAFVTMLHLNLVETDAKKPTETMALTKERDCNRTPSRLWVAFCLKEYSYVSSQYNDYYVILITELIVKRDYQLTGDGRPTCQVLNVGFLRGDSLLEQRLPNDQFQHRVCEAVGTYLRVDSPTSKWTFLGDGDECEDEERGAYCNGHGQSPCLCPEKVTTYSKSLSAHTKTAVRESVW